MSGTRLDPRLHAYRPELADSRLRGAVEAERFADGMLKRIVAPTAALKGAPDDAAKLETELLRGEVFRVFADTAGGWSWGQSQTDSYVGFVPSAALGAFEPPPTHRVTALRSFVYAGPDMQLPAVAALSLGAELTLGEPVETRGLLYRTIAGTETAVCDIHVAPLDAPREADFVAVAERFINAPYLWGGRTSLGLDCSALVQLSLAATGFAAPRDTYVQRDALGVEVEGGVEAELRRGDLLFWPGHVAILSAPDRVVHASGHQMMVVEEPLMVAVERIAAVKKTHPLVKRL